MSSFHGAVLLSVRSLSTAASNGAKSFSEIPSPEGKFPILGHAYEMKKRSTSNKGISRIFDELFRELGTIFKIEFPGMVIISHSQHAPEGTMGLAM